jgi:serine/threonine protein kinase
LHSGNILYIQGFNQWYISDLGFCGPADKPLGSIYGNLPYIAPEVIAGKGYTKASDIYGIAMLMCEISSGQPPFANFEYSDYDLAMNIINGMRPKILPGIPLEYKELMEQCWDADPLKRPDIYTVFNKVDKMLISYYQNENGEQQTNNITINLKLNSNFNTNSNSINSLVRRFSKIHIFEGLPDEPRNATEGMILK